MEDNIFQWLSTLFNELFPIVLIWIVWFALKSFFSKYSKIKKLKSGEMPSHVIKGTVSDIKYITSWKNNSWTISSRYFIAKWTDALSNEEMQFESDIFPYKDTWFKIRFMWPNEEDEKKLFEYIRTFVKEWDMVKIHISNDNTNIYYIEDIVKSDDDSFNNIPQIPGNIINFVKWLNIGSKNSKDAFVWIKNFRKSLFFMVIVFVFWPLIFKFLGDTSNWINLQLPKLNFWMNLNFWWSYIVRIIVALLVIFIIYKLIVGYRGSKK